MLLVCTMQNDIINTTLKNFNIDLLDTFEMFLYNDMIRHNSKENVLMVLINNVEGDYSQLSDGLFDLANEIDSILNN